MIDALYLDAEDDAFELDDLGGYTDLMSEFLDK